MGKRGLFRAALNIAASTLGESVGCQNTTGVDSLGEAVPIQPMLLRVRGQPLPCKPLDFFDLRGGHLACDDVAVLASIFTALR
jgi:hypothetical protein